MFSNRVLLYKRINSGDSDSPRILNTTSNKFLGLSLHVSLGPPGLRSAVVYRQTRREAWDQIQDVFSPVHHTFNTRLPPPSRLKSQPPFGCSDAGWALRRMWVWSLSVYRGVSFTLIALMIRFCWKVARWLIILQILLAGCVISGLVLRGWENFNPVTRVTCQ